MRKVPAAHLRVRGATPELTVIKHKLRDWVESRLTPLAWDGGPEALARQLNEELKQAGLVCANDHPPQPGETVCPDWSQLGFLSQIKLYRPARSEFLVLQTGVGIECGFDESPYAYGWIGDQWRRFWQSEQDDYAEKKYLPQTLQAVLISPTDFRPEGDKSTHLVLTLGREPWCSSNWHDVYIRLWRTKAGVTEPKPLLDEREWAWVVEPILGAVDREDVLIEYTVRSIDVGVHHRQQVRHYVVKQDKVERTDPIALGPRDFADEWLGIRWDKSSGWTERAARTKADKWNEELRGPFEYIDPTMHCSDKPDLWQVDVGDPDNEVATRYFLIRWRPPFRFTMVDVSDHPWAGCTEEDPSADEDRTLFAGQEWR